CRFLDDRGIDDLYAQSRIVRIDDVDIRVPSPEDHLRLLCLHFLGHGAWRPLWLCDIGVALESRPPDFDWDRFFGGRRRWSEWAMCAIALAHRLLDAHLDETPLTHYVSRLPGWLVPAVLRQWSTNPRPPGRLPVVFAVAANPAGILAEVR